VSDGKDKKDEEAFDRLMNAPKDKGIGDKIQLRLNNIKIHTIRDLQNAEIFILRKEFKRVGSEWHHAVAWGYDEREVTAWSHSEHIFLNSLFRIKGSASYKSLIV
jgi:nucleotidyltransferase/DNA polymerase involved in DNA repair